MAMTTNTNHHIYYYSERYLSPTKGKYLLQYKMEHALVKLLKKRWLVGNRPALAMYTVRRIIEDIHKCVADELANVNLFPKLKRIRRSRSCPYFFSA